jgi:hypothetical protein
VQTLGRILYCLATQLEQIKDIVVKSRGLQMIPGQCLRVCSQAPVKLIGQDMQGPI